LLAENEDEQTSLELMEELDKISMIDIDYHEEALNADFFASTFYSLIKEYKDEYLVLQEDQAQYYLESMFIITVQVVFLWGIVKGTNINIADAF